MGNLEVRALRIICMQFASRLCQAIPDGEIRWPQRHSSLFFISRPLKTSEMLVSLHKIWRRICTQAGFWDVSAPPPLFRGHDSQIPLKRQRLDLNFPSECLKLQASSSLHNSPLAEANEQRRDKWILKIGSALESPKRCSIYRQMRILRATLKHPVSHSSRIKCHGRHQLRTKRTHSLWCGTWKGNCRKISIKI